MTEGLINEGAKIYHGHDESNICSEMTVVYSTDIKNDNPEYLAAIKRQCKLLHRSDLLADLVEGHQSLAVTGTHGKTTTSALLSTVLVQAGLDPSFAVGGMLPQFHANSRFGNGPWFAFEADESDCTFLKYFPFGAIITNIDNDHLNYYQGKFERLLESFRQFASQVKSSSHLFWCGDDPHLKTLNLPGISYGFSEDCKWKIVNFRQEGFHIFFDIMVEGDFYNDVELSLTGRHNALNALAVFALARTIGIDEKQIRLAFRSFQGVMRRCEKKGEISEVLFLDDYAHHPTEVKATLKAIRHAVRERKMIAIFQPHRYSRTKDCLGMYGTIFNDADLVVITDIFGAGEPQIQGLKADLIVKEVNERSNIPVKFLERDLISHFLADHVRPHDVVVTLGAGDITKVSAETLSLLNRYPPRPLRVGVIFGGTKTEHEISIRSAQHFLDTFKTMPHYQVEEFGITQSGKWMTGPDMKHRLESLQESEGNQTSPLTQDVIEKLIACDVLVPVLHGPLGEDGTVQGLLETFKKAYVGCDHRSAAISMDKVVCKKLVLIEGIKTSPFVDFSNFYWREKRESLLQEIKEKLHFPVFVKPIHLGSTVGVRKVSDFSYLADTIDEVFTFDTHILIENGIEGREIEFAVLGNSEGYVFPPGEIFTEGKMYDYQAKYSSLPMKSSSRAELPHELIEEGRKLAAKAYQAIGCSGLSRVDFFLDSEGTFWFNETNPMPGFTANSLYPKMCEVNGLAASQLMSRLIILALERRRSCDRIFFKT